MREAVIFHILKANFLQYTRINLFPLGMSKLDKKRCLTDQKKMAHHCVAVAHAAEERQ